MSGIITENYKLVYCHAKNVRFKGILAYPNTLRTITIYVYLEYIRKEQPLFQQFPSDPK